MIIIIIIIINNNNNNNINNKQMVYAQPNICPRERDTQTHMGF